MATTAPDRGESDARSRQPVRRYLRFMPAMRSAYIERFQGSPDSTTLYLYGEYIDESIIDRTRYRRARRPAVLRAILRWDYTTLALPEPFWITQLPFVTLLALAARVRSVVSRRPLDIVTYAIENADSSLLLGLPGRLPAGLRRRLLSSVASPYVHLLDRVAFGTDGARRNYLEGLNGAARARISARSRVFEPLAANCACTTGIDKIPHSVLFLGPLEERKGLDMVLDVWPDVVNDVPGAVLTVCGDGPLRGDVEELARRYPGVELVAGASRSQMHRLLAEAGILVTLPRPMRRWREQIGLSITEGLSHGCHVVTTDQTGLAEWLRRHAQTVVPADDVSAAKQALTLAIRSGLPGAEHAMPTTGGRVVAERWMYGGHDR